MSLPSIVQEKLMNWFGFPKKETFAQVATSSNHHPSIRTMMLEEITPEGTLVFLTHKETRKWSDLSSFPFVAIAFVHNEIGQIVAEGKAHLKTKKNPEIHHYWKNLPRIIQKIYTPSPKEDVPDSFGAIFVEPKTWEILELNKTDYHQSFRKVFLSDHGSWKSKDLQPL